jgi:hypothetical protein
MIDLLDVYHLSPAQLRAIQNLNRAMIARTEALQRELENAARDAGLDDDLAVDFITGGLQTALDNAQRLAYRLATPRATQRLRDRADFFYQKAPSGVPTRITVDRPDRTRDSRTYDLARVSPASRARLLAFLHWEWPTRRTTPQGWFGLSTAR